MSADGTHSAFTTRADNVLPDDRGPGIFLRDDTTGEVQRVSDDTKDLVNISADGRYVLYTELDPGPDGANLYAYDGEARSTRSFSVADSGIGYKPVITPDGSRVMHGTSTLSSP